MTNASAISSVSRKSVSSSEFRFSTNVLLLNSCFAQWRTVPVHYYAHTYLYAMFISMMLKHTNENWVHKAKKKSTLNIIRNAHTQVRAPTTIGQETIRPSAYTAAMCARHLLACKKQASQNEMSCFMLILHYNPKVRRL